MCMHCVHVCACVFYASVCLMHLCVSLCVCWGGHNIKWISYQGSQSNILENTGVDGP